MKVNLFGGKDDDSLAFKIETTGYNLDSGLILSFDIQSNFIANTFDTLNLEIWGPTKEKFQEIRREVKPLRLVSFAINGNDIFIGTIDKVDTKEDAVLTLSCSDYRKRLVSAYVDVGTNINAGETLEAAALKICKPLGITEVDADGFNSMRTYLTNGALTFAGTPEIDAKKIKIGNAKAAKGNQGAYEMLLEFCEKAGCLIQPTTSRSKIALCKPEFRQDPLFKFKRTFSGQGTNVLSASLTEDYSQVSTVYIGNGKFKSVEGEKLADGRIIYDIFDDDSTYPVNEVGRVKDVVTGVVQTGHIKAGTSGDNRLFYRPFFLDSQSCKTKAELDALIKRTISAGLSQCLVLTYELGGFFDANGFMYAQDTLATVDDEIFDLFDTFYITQRAFSFRNGAGARTSLSLIHPKLFSL